MEQVWIMLLPLLDVLGLPWPLWPWLVVPALLLGFPWLLAGWAWWRLRTAPAGRPGRFARPRTAAPPLTGWSRLVRAYLLANYAAAVPLLGQRGEKALAMASYLVLVEWGQGCTALLLLVTNSRWSYLLISALLTLLVWAGYRWVLPRVELGVARHRTAATYNTLLPRQQSAWGVLGQALVWGSFTFIFICFIISKKYESP